MKKIRQGGFTLTELMIVIAIIGVLAAIAIPNFQKFSARSRQSEVKLNLSGFYIAEKAYFAEYGTYRCEDLIGGVTYLSTCGFMPEANNLYTYKFASYLYLAQKGLGNLARTNCAPIYGRDPGTNTYFHAGGCANIDGDSFEDHWAINQNNHLYPVQDDVDDSTNPVVP